MPRISQRAIRYETGKWKTDELFDLAPNGRTGAEDYLEHHLEESFADARERSRLFRLLGLINYRILSGNKVYIEVGGIVYRTVYGGYWRSVFTGVEHFLLRCQAVSGGVWTDDGNSLGLIDLPISHTKDGWTAQGHSLMFMLNRE